MNDKERIIDVIPIYKGEMIPTKQMWWHYALRDDINEEYLTNILYYEIKRKFFDCNCILIVENGKVLETLVGE